MEWEAADSMDVDEEEVPPSHKLQDMPWDNSYGECPLHAWCCTVKGFQPPLHYILVYHYNNTVHHCP